jgi:hypothetical protein
LLTVVGLAHTEDVANRATRRVADNHHPAFQGAVANDPSLTIALTGVFDLDRHAIEHENCVSEIESTIGERLGALGRIVADADRLLYLQ